jgi:diguanylate cyclase
LHDIGVKLSIDDFGTGYSSLSYLKTLPIDSLKIDRSFVTNIATDKEDAVIVQSVIDLGRNLGLQVVAEGVEDRQVADMLVQGGCHAGQGFFWLKGVTADELSHLLDGLDQPAPEAASIIA